MSENKRGIFLTDDTLANAIRSQTENKNGKFECRDFVLPLIRYCLDDEYAAKIGIVFGLRSTGKTVGMLQAAQSLIASGHKVAYARFNYRKTGMNEVNAEILHLADEGFTHFFIDEAPYLSGFLTDCAEWADTFVPAKRVKIVISGTDSFELWLTMNRSLYHRYVRFSTNRNTFPEFHRVLGQSYEEYKTVGGVFLSNAESETEGKSHGENKAAIEQFIQAAVVENLIHTLEHCNEGYDNKNYYYDWLYAIDKQVIFKGIISILESTVWAAIRKNFIQDIDYKNIPALGSAISKWDEIEKRDMKARIADSLNVYQEFRKIENPAGTIDALVEFLIKVGCLLESSTSTSDLVDGQRTLYFAHNALMNYAVGETVRGILTLTDIDQQAFIDALKQAAEGSINENIVYFHLLHSLKGNQKIFRYRDADNREIDAVIIDRDAKTLTLIEVKSKMRIEKASLVKNEAKHLLDDVILKNIGVSDDYTIIRAIVYKGQDIYAEGKDTAILLISVETLLKHYQDLDDYLLKRLEQARAKIAHKKANRDAR
jgi:predicted AAA+ superfamily ATPase